MSKNKIKELTKKIISTALEEHLEATLEMQDILADDAKNREEMVEIILKNLKSEKDELKLRRLITAACVFEIKDATKQIEGLIDHENSFIKEDAILALGILKDKSKIKDLIKILETKDDIAREEAAIALGLMGVKDAVDPLIDQLDDEDPDIVISSSIALSELQDPKAIDPLVELMTSDNKYIRRYAASALFTFGRSALNPLNEKLGQISFLERISKKGREITKLIKEIDKSDLTEVKEKYAQSTSSS
jgi:HEAT repeat protein